MVETSPAKCNDKLTVGQAAVLRLTGLFDYQNT